MPIAVQQKTAPVQWGPALPWEIPASPPLKQWSAPLQRAPVQVPSPPLHAAAASGLLPSSGPLFSSPAVVCSSPMGTCSCFAMGGTSFSPPAKVCSSPARPCSGSWSPGSGEPQPHHQVLPVMVEHMHLAIKLYVVKHNMMS